jgi:hypothetical protein
LRRHLDEVLRRHQRRHLRSSRPRPRPAVGEARRRREDAGGLAEIQGAIRHQQVGAVLHRPESVGSSLGLRCLARDRDTHMFYHKWLRCPRVHLRSLCQRAPRRPKLSILASGTTQGL